MGLWRKWTNRIIQHQAVINWIYSITSTIYNYMCFSCRMAGKMDIIKLKNGVLLTIKIVEWWIAKQGGNTMNTCAHMKWHVNIYCEVLSFFSMHRPEVITILVGSLKTILRLLSSKSCPFVAKISFLMVSNETKQRLSFPPLPLLQLKLISLAVSGPMHLAVHAF